MPGQQIVAALLLQPRFVFRYLFDNIGKRRRSGLTADNFLYRVGNIGGRFILQRIGEFITNSASGASMAAAASAIIVP